MANKKYNEFPEGTYDTTKIFLQADPTTGALEKVLLPNNTFFEQMIIQQFGTSAPDINEVNYIPGLDPTASRLGVGRYSIDINTAVIPFQYFVMASYANVSNAFSFVVVSVLLGPPFFILTYDSTGNLSDTILSDFELTLLFYSRP